MSRPIHIVVVAGATERVRSELAPALKQDQQVLLVAPRTDAVDLSDKYINVLVRDTTSLVRSRQGKGQDIFRISLWYYDLNVSRPWFEQLRIGFGQLPILQRFLVPVIIMA